METATLQTGQMAMGLLGGLALFLFGLDQLTSALKAVAGARLRDVLASVTTNRFKGVLAGGFTTAVIQSSSVTTVLTVGFVSAGLLSLPQAIGVIMGAEIGTTVTAQIIAFKVTKFALVGVIIGFSMYFFFKDERIKRYGTIVLGLGLVFLGMNMMGDATRPLRTYQPFIDMMQQMNNPLFAVLMSATFTALIQSSSATTGIIIVMAGQGLITLEQGIALVFGANIGTCVTALLASINKPRAAVRTALVHVMFNVAGVTLWINFIDEIAQIIRMISPVSADLDGMARLAAETPRQIANAHTLFNVGNTFIFIWFAGTFAWVVTKLVPEKEVIGPQVIKPRYLDSVLLEAPSVALDGVRRELVRLGLLIEPMVKDAPRMVMTGSESNLATLLKMDEDVDTLHAAIISYLGEISRQNLRPEETERLHDYIGIANYFESIGDMVEIDLGHTGERRIELGVLISPRTMDDLTALSEKVLWSVQTVVAAIDRQDKSLAQEVMAAKPVINAMVDEVSDHIARRLIAEAPQRTETFQVESEMIEELKRIYYLAKRIAKLIVEINVVKDSGEATSESQAA